MARAEFDGYPIISSHLISSHPGSGERVILGQSLSPGDISINFNLPGREKFSRNLALAMGGSLLALLTACVSNKPPEPSSGPSVTPQAIVTPVSIGPTLSENCQKNPLARRGFTRATEDQQTRQTGQVVGGGLLTLADNDATTALNACVLAKKAADEATATAEAQEKMIPEVIALIGEPTGYRPATKEEVNLFTEQVWNKGTPNEQRGVAIPRPGIKTDSQGNLLIPRYPPGTILGELETIRAENYYPEEVATGRQQQIYRWMGQIEQVIQEVRSRDFKKAKEFLNNTIWVHGIQSASEFDKYDFKIGRVSNNPDKNGDGISDLFESAYNLIKKALSRLA